MNMTAWFWRVWLVMGQMRTAVLLLGLCALASMMMGFKVAIFAVYYYGGLRRARRVAW